MKLGNIYAYSEKGTLEVDNNNIITFDSDNEENKESQHIQISLPQVESLEYHEDIKEYNPLTPTIRNVMIVIVLVSIILPFTIINKLSITNSSMILIFSILSVSVTLLILILSKFDLSEKPSIQYIRVKTANHTYTFKGYTTDITENDIKEFYDKLCRKKRNLSNKT